ncbi:stage V sporulation protein AC [Alkalihalobacillus sp. TS-13]|uniref:stage V sporulation protein AC n=1 Tax=Alkalihalobacillus sp. TS-13 TaxID=2842455 RepID=UPI0021AAD5E1|nr:stage V sporulation protein AC [Alkalihalobacillus sp. TS-13]
MSPEQQAYKEKIKPLQPKPPYVWNCIKAFLIGGLICAIGQGITNFYITFFNFTEKTAGNPTVATLILAAALLTGIGIYDKIGQFSGAGSIVPVTGFANAVTSAALEHKSEGIVLGVATNLFKLAGAVIVFGAVAAYVIGMIRYLFQIVF